MLSNVLCQYFFFELSISFQVEDLVADTAMALEIALAMEVTEAMEVGCFSLQF